MLPLRSVCAAVPAALLGWSWLAADDSSPQPSISRQPDGDMLVSLPSSPGTTLRLETSTNLLNWQPLATTTATNSSIQHRDSAAIYHPSRHYRFTPAPQGALTGDHLATTDGDILIRPINHASFLLQWKNIAIYCDPVGSASLYSTLPKADVVIISHSHSDHWSSSTVSSIRNTSGCAIFAPQAVANAMNTTLRPLTTIMANNTSASIRGFSISAIPAYNSNHPVGSGNGYVLTIAGTRLYFSGDTGDIPETRALTNIDAAFLCMNIPFTMNVSSAVSVVRAFRPRIIYPYHYRNQDNSLADLRLFEDLVSTDLGIEVRTRPWY